MAPGLLKGTVPSPWRGEWDSYFSVLNASHSGFGA